MGIATPVCALARNDRFFDSLKRHRKVPLLIYFFLPVTWYILSSEIFTVT